MPKRGRAQRRRRRRKGSQRRESVASYNPGLRLTEPSATKPYGASLRWHLRMGLSNMDARFLTGETCAEEISELLRFETECRRCQLHLPPVAKRDDRPELDRRNARAFSLHHQGARGAHAYQAVEDRLRIS